MNFLLKMVNTNVVISYFTLIDRDLGQYFGPQKIGKIKCDKGQPL